jgi:hypothetical protein
MRTRLIASSYSAQATVPGRPVEPVGDCSKGPGPAVRDWVQPPTERRRQARRGTTGRLGGRLLCYTSANGWAAIEWTDKLNDVYSNAFGPKRYGLYRWWRVRGGPAAS